MKTWIKDVLKYIIYRFAGSSSFVRRIEWRSILKYLDPKEGERILDVASGDGFLSLKIAERGCDVCAIDISEESVNLAKRFAEKLRITCEFRVGNAQDLSYPDGYFDKIVCSSSLEHFEDDVRALKEMTRVLKPGGSIVLTVDSFTYPISNHLKEQHRKIAHVVNYYTRETLKERFEIAGFEVRRSEYLLNSWLTSLFFNYGIKLRWSPILWIPLSIIVYPLCAVSERLFGKADKGYTLIAEGKN